MDTSTLSIEGMIAAARQARAAEQAEIEARKRERFERARGDFHTILTSRFGDLVSMLDMTIEVDEYSTAAVFDYQDHTYRLVGRDNWYLSRVEPRDEDDDRPLPATNFVSTHNGVAASQRDFLLALSDLSEQPDNLRYRYTAKAEAEPTLAERFDALLREYIREMSGGEW